MSPKFSYWTDEINLIINKVWDCLSILSKLKEGKNPNQQTSNQTFKGELVRQYELRSALVITLKMYHLVFTFNLYFSFVFCYQFSLVIQLPKLHSCKGKKIKSSKQMQNLFLYMNQQERLNGWVLYQTLVLPLC